MRTIILLAALLVTGLAQAGSERIDETWYEYDSGEPIFMQSFDGGRNWYGWEQGRHLHFIEKRRGWWSRVSKGRLAYDADSLRACSAELPFGRMECE
jgi:hypothetical protein